MGLSQRLMSLAMCSMTYSEKFQMNLVAQKPRNFIAFLRPVKSGEVGSEVWVDQERGTRSRRQPASLVGSGSHDQQWLTGASQCFFCVANGFCVFFTELMLLSTMLSCFLSRIPANVLIKSDCMKDESSGIASNRSGTGPQGFPAETLQSMDRTLPTRPQTQTIIIFIINMRRSFRFRERIRLV